ncbi:MAG: PQQ-binding-like beta-propeller repeat protein [Pseudomonadota bacterium]|nr:PQQ-binding-like beta-propeller repeat protein [Pseudomonadota bacterium]
MRKILVLALLILAIPVRADVNGNPAAGQASNGGCPAVQDTMPDRAAGLAGPHWTGWGVDGAQSRFQPAAMARLAPEDVPRLKLKWAFGFPGAKRAIAPPAVLGGHLFVGSRSGKVYSLDAKSGCVHWAFDAGAPVRTAISIGQGARGWSVYFGDQRANAYGVDAASGELVWKLTSRNIRAP